MGWAILGVAVIGGIVCLATLLRAKQHAGRDIDDKISRLEGQRTAQSEQIGKLRAKQSEAQRAVEAALQQAGIATLQDYLRLAEQREQLADDNERDASRLSGVLGDIKLKDLQETLSQLNLDRMALRQLLESPEMVAAEMEPADIRALEAEIEQLEEDVGSLDDKLRNARAVVAQARYDVEDEVRIDEEVAAAEQSVNRLAQYQEVLALTTEVLEEARQQTMHSAIDAVGPTINEYLAVLTDGRYDQVQISDDLAPVVYSQEKSDFVDPEDELSLATRAGLSGLPPRLYQPLVGDRRPAHPAG